MPESGAYGSVRGALSNERPYRDPDDGSFQIDVMMAEAAAE